MVPTTRFSFQKEQKHDYIQPECPVYVHCIRQCTDLRSGMHFFQMRMINRGEHTVKTVVFCVEGLDENGRLCCTMRGLVMGDCKAAPRKVFGEGRMFALKQTAYQIRVRVEQVIFADGMSWRRQNGQKLLEIGKSNWKRCTCAMPNAPDNEQCILCGKKFPLPSERESEEMSASLPENDFKLPLYTERPAPIIRENYFVESQQEESSDERVPVWLVVLVSILGALALVVLLYFGVTLFGNGAV